MHYYKEKHKNTKNTGFVCVCVCWGGGRSMVK